MEKVIEYKMRPVLEYQNVIYRSERTKQGEEKHKATCLKNRKKRKSKKRK